MESQRSVAILLDFTADGDSSAQSLSAVLNQLIHCSWKDSSLEVFIQGFCPSSHSERQALEALAHEQGLGLHWLHTEPTAQSRIQNFFGLSLLSSAEYFLWISVKNFSGCSKMEFFFKKVFIRLAMDAAKLKAFRKEALVYSRLWWRLPIFDSSRESTHSPVVLLHRSALSRMRSNRRAVLGKNVASFDTLPFRLYMHDFSIQKVYLSGFIRAFLGAAKIIFTRRAQDWQRSRQFFFLCRNFHKSQSPSKSLRPHQEPQRQQP